MNRKLLMAGAIAPVVSLLVFHLDMITRPGYDLLRHGPSLLMTGERGWLEIANFVLTGAVMIAAAAGHRPGWGRTLIAVYGFAMICTGVFVTDPQIGYPPGTPPGLLPGVNAPSTWHGTLHFVGVFLMYGAAVAACLVFARSQRSRLLVGLAIAMPAVLVSGALVFQTLALTSPFFALLDGICGRLIIPLGWLWAVAVNAREVRS